MQVYSCSLLTVTRWNPPTASAFAGPSTGSGTGSASATPPQGGSDSTVNRAGTLNTTNMIAAENSEAAPGGEFRLQFVAGEFVQFCFLSSHCACLFDWREASVLPFPIGQDAKPYPIGINGLLATATSSPIAP